MVDNVGQLLNMQNTTEVASEVSKEYLKSKFIKKVSEIQTFYQQIKSQFSAQTKFVSLTTECYLCL